MSASLRAVSIGPAVPPGDFEAAVHSAFHKALNLQLAQDGALLTLLCSGQGDLPQGIRLDAPQGFGFDTIAAGTRGSCRGGMLTLGHSLIVDLREAHLWDCDLPSLDGDMARPAVAAAWRCAREAVASRRGHLGLAMLTGDPPPGGPRPESLMLQQMDRAAIRILRATRQFDVAGMHELRALVGLGPGLTPGGDDLLTGYVAGLWCTVRGKPERQRFLSAVGELVIRFSSDTNAIGRTYLLHAARGQVSSRLFDLAWAICNGIDRERVLACAQAAMDVGHTSGVEAVNGLLLGLAAWDGADLIVWGPDQLQLNCRT